MVVTPLTQAKILKVKPRETLPKHHLRPNLPHPAIMLSVKNFLMLTGCASIFKVTNDLKTIMVIIPQPITADLVPALVTPAKQKKPHTQPLQTPVVSLSHHTLDDWKVIDLTGVDASSP